MKKLVSPPILASFTLLIIIFAYFSFHAPYMADNFAFSRDLQPGFAQLYTGAKVNAYPLTISSAFRQAWDMYSSWCGRFAGNLAVYLIFLLPPFLLHLLPSLGFAIYILLLQICIFGDKWLENLSPGWILGLAALLWISVPSFGQAFFWLSVGGQIALFAQLLMLLPYRLALSAPQKNPLSPWLAKIGALLFFLAGMITSSLDFPSSAALPPTAFAAIAWLYFSRPKDERKISWILLCGAVGLLIGAILTLLAPGNGQRLLLTNDPSVIKWLSLSWPEKITHWLIRLPLIPTLFPVPFIILLWGLDGLWKAKRKNFFSSLPVAALLFFLPFCFTIGAFLFSAWPPSRAFASCAVQLLICSLIIAVQVKNFASRSMLRLWHYSQYLLFIWCVTSVIYEGSIFRSLNKTIKIRENIIIHSYGKDVILPALNVPSSRYQALGGDLQDISQDPTFWINRAIALHYGLNTVRKESAWPSEISYFSENKQLASYLKIHLDKDRFYIKAKRTIVAALLEKGAYIYYYGKPALLAKIPSIIGNKLYRWISSLKEDSNFRWLIPILMARTDLDSIETDMQIYSGRSPLLKLENPDTIWLVQPGGDYKSFNLIPFMRKTSQEKN